MSYSIRYGPHKTKKPEKDSPKKYYYFGILLVLIAGALHFLWPQGTETLRQILVPWADGPTVEAFQKMLAQVGEGENISDALLAFCREIVSNAGVFS